MVVAAGSGERLGAAAPKAFVRCGGRPLLDWSLDALGAVCDRVVAAVPPGAESGCDRVVGGASRSQSVLAALSAAPEGEAYVVQDAARPLVTVELIERCVAALDGGFDAAVAAARVTDTVKEAAADGRVRRTLERSGLWAVQTPQAFRGDALREALAIDPARLVEATDDASLVEAAGGSVTVVEAPAENIKVTRPIDLVIAELLLDARTGEASGAMPAEGDDPRC